MRASVAIAVDRQGALAVVKRAVAAAGAASGTTTGWGAAGFATLGGCIHSGTITRG